MKRLCAFYAYKKTFGRRRGLKPRMAHSMYTAVIIIFTYGSLVWWRVVDTKVHLSLLYKGPTLSNSYNYLYNDINSSGQFEETAGSDPLDVYIKYVSARSALRFSESDDFNKFFIVEVPSNNKWSVKQH